tara:strand:+ start:667 stop:840 length:174 start_codon:yes stop_codon:yes gene_type:complete
VSNIRPKDEDQEVTKVAVPEIAVSNSKEIIKQSDAMSEAKLDPSSPSSTTDLSGLFF